MTTDFDSYFRNKIECLLIKSSWVGQVQQRLALEAVSQVWSDRPEWYFWIRGAPGVYSLALADGRGLKVGNQDLSLGQFTVKCYPHPHCDAFGGFSACEQTAVMSNLFDETHTPCIETRNRIPDMWFTVGSVSVLMSEAQTVTLLTYDSLEKMRLSRSPEQYQRESCTRARDADNLIRNIPGWELGYTLFDCLIGLYAFYCRRAPSFVGAACSPGFECVLAPDQGIRCQSTDATRQLALSVLFVEPGRFNGQVDTFWRQRLDPGEEVAYAAECKDAALKPIEIPELSPAIVNPLWWELAAGDYKSEKTTTCGCGTHDHHTCLLES